MDVAIVYSTGCPKCNVLEQKLKQKDIDHIIINDVNVMIEKGFDFLPVLEVNGKAMGFKEAVKWIGEQ